MIKKQPSLKFCDICGKEITKHNGANDASVRLKIDGLDFAGVAVGDASEVYDDVCDKCIQSISKHIDTIRK